MQISYEMVSTAHVHQLTVSLSALEEKKAMFESVLQTSKSTVLINAISKGFLNCSRSSEVLQIQNGHPWFSNFLEEDLGLNLLTTMKTITANAKKHPSNSHSSCK